MAVAYTENYGTCLRAHCLCIYDTPQGKTVLPLQLFKNPRAHCQKHTYLKQLEPDQIAAWASGGAGLFTDGILQTVRDTTSLSAQR